MITDSQRLELLVRLLGRADVDRRGINAQFWCPFCRSDDEAKRKLAVRISDGAVHCWVCGWSARNISSLARAVGARDALTELEAAFGRSRRFDEDDEPASPTPVMLPPDFKLVSKLVERRTGDPDHEACLRYVGSRGVTLEAAWRFCLGVSDVGAYRRRVLFPSFDASGRLNYLTARAVDADVRPRYLNVDADRKDVVFGEVNVDWGRELVLVEGPFDMLSCYGVNVTSVLGSRLDESYALFNRIVINRTPVVLAMDPDAARKQDILASRLLRYGVRVRAVSWAGRGEKEDPSEVGTATFREMIRASSDVDRSTLLRSRIGRALEPKRLV